MYYIIETVMNIMVLTKNKVKLRIKICLNDRLTEYLDI